MSIAVVRDFISVQETILLNIQANGPSADGTKRNVFIRPARLDPDRDCRPSYPENRRQTERKQIKVERLAAIVFRKRVLHSVRRTVRQQLAVLWWLWRSALTPGACVVSYKKGSKAMNRSSSIGVLCASLSCASVIWAGGATSGHPPTFTKDVAPILYKNCATCHRAGEIAPMSLLTYQEARPWAKAIRENIALGKMPPWHATQGRDTFS